MSGYRVPARRGESEYVEKRSSFLGVVEPVSTEEEARAVIASVKKLHHDARHNCWCYLINGGPERYSDDGPAILAAFFSAPAGSSVPTREQRKMPSTMPVRKKFSPKFTSFSPAPIHLPSESVLKRFPSAAP